MITTSGSTGAHYRLRSAAKPALALTCLAALAGCGEKPEPAPAPSTAAVGGTVALERDAGGGADAGTTAGHRPSFRGTTGSPTFTFTGSVDPASATVALRPGATVRRSGARFTVRVTGLHRGANRFVLEGRAGGRAPWRVDLTIVRR